MSRTVPQFSSVDHDGLVPTFRRHSWKNFSEGVVGVSSANRPHMVARIHEPLDRAMLQQALQIVADRHASVLSSVVEEDGRPHLSFQAIKLVEIEFRDLRATPPEQRDAVATQTAADHVWRPFDMRTGLLRAFLIQLADDDYVFGVVLHHFICDGLGIGLFWREVRACHRALAHGGPLPFSGKPMQYTDYLLSVQAWIESEDGAKQLDYWKERLAAPPAPARVEARDGRAATDGRQAFELDATLCEQLHAVAREQKTSVFAVLLGAQFVMLRNLTGRTDQIVTCVTNGRENAVLQPVVGYLADKLHYRVDLLGEPSFEDVMRLTWSAISGGARAQFVRSDFIAQALAERGEEILAPGFNFGPAPPKISRPPPPSPSVAGPAPTNWAPIVMPAPGALSPPGPGVCHYWLELVEQERGMSGYFHHKAPLLPGLLDSFRAVLARVAARDPAPITAWS